MSIVLDGSNLTTNGLINSLTAQNTSTGATYYDFTGIPAGTKRVTLMFSNVGTSGTADVIVQLGYSGGIVTSGYLGTATNNGSNSNHSNGFRDGNQNSVCRRHGVYTLTHMGSNVWACGASCGRSDTGCYNLIAGSVPLLGALTTVRVTTFNGTDTFTAGSVNILYE